MGVFPSLESRGRLRIQTRAQFSGVSAGDLWLYGPLSADQPSHHASSAVGRSACAESEQLSWTRLLPPNDHPGRCLRAPRGDRSGPGAVHRDQLYRHVYPAFLWEVSSYCSLPCGLSLKMATCAKRLAAFISCKQIGLLCQISGKTEQEPDSLFILV